MSIPINQKRFITIVEAEEYFSIGRKSLQAFAANHPDLAFLHGNASPEISFDKNEIRNIIQHAACG